MGPLSPVAVENARDSSAAAALRPLLDRARELAHTGHPAAAVSALRRIRRVAGPIRDREVEAIVARTYLTEAAARLDIAGDHTACLTLIEKAEVIGRSIDMPGLTATALAQKALLVLRSGDPEHALSVFDAAAAHMADMEPRDRAIVMLNRGVLWLERGDLRRAQRDLRDSGHFARDVDDARLESMARHNLGYVEFLAGQIPRALAAYEDAARTWPEGLHPAMKLDHARALREAGLLSDADSVLAEVVQRTRELRLFQDLAETELVRAECALADGDVHRARMLAASARRRFARRHNLRWQRKAEILALRCELTVLSETAARRPVHRLTSLASRADILGDSCRHEGRSDLARQASLLAAECLLRAGRDPGGPPPRLRAVDSLPTRLQVREVRAMAALQVGDLRRAHEEVRRGLEELGWQQGHVGSLDLRTAMARNGVALARVGLDLAVHEGSAAAVLATVERSRAISTRLPPIRPPSDDETAALLAELRHVEEEARALEGEPGASGQVTRLRLRASGLQRDIRARSWTVESDSPLVARAPRLAHVQRAVQRSRSGFVSFVRHRGAWLAVVVRPSGSELVHLASGNDVTEGVRRVRADLDALALPQLPEPVTAAIHASLRSSLGRLDEMLLGPLRVGDRPLVVSCSGPLAVLPWGLLPSRLGQPTIVTPAATTWLAAQEIARRPDRPEVVALAGPGLHQSLQEAQRISNAWQAGRLLAGEEAVTSAARAVLAGSDLVHIGAHGTHRPESPLFSCLRLADGPLYAYELDAGPRGAGCVTLSACEAGLATLRPGDEGLGLTQALLHLGVRSVVAAVARVRDDVAATTMERVHTAMASGLSSAEALALAQQEADRDAPPAPFVCFGGSW